MQDKLYLLIREDMDVVNARQRGRALSEQIGFSTSDQALIATVISELARNILVYALNGEMIIEKVQKEKLSGIKVIALDKGPGISDIEQAMQDGFSTSKGLGLGLPGSRRIMDDFEIISRVGTGTTVIATKWLNSLCLNERAMKAK